MTDAVLCGDVSDMSRDCFLSRELFITPHMENVISALSRLPEDMPQWLRDYRPGDRVSFADFMSSRIGYYPGSGYDGCLVSTCNRAHCVHCFIQVDYGIAERDLKSEAEQFNAFRGYHVIGRVDWTERDLAPNGQYAYNFVMTDREKERAMSFVSKDVAPYCFMEVYERNADRGEEWGAERFAVTFLFADGIATYYQLFCREYRKAPWIYLLQDHGFGGNYAAFGRDSLMERVMKANGCWPGNVLCGDNTYIWDGYEKVKAAPVIGGMHRNRRFLYTRERQGAKE